MLAFSPVGGRRKKINTKKRGLTIINPLIADALNTPYIYIRFLIQDNRNAFALLIR